MLLGDPAATMNPSQTTEVSRLPRPVLAATGTKDPEQQHRRRRKVVLKGVGKKEGAHAEGNQRQLQTEPVEKARVARAGKGDTRRGPSHDGKDWERGDKDGEEDEEADQEAPEPFAERPGSQTLLGVACVGIRLRVARGNTHSQPRYFGRITSLLAPV